MGERILQRVVMPLRRKLTRLYYRSAGESPQVDKRSRQRILLPRGSVLRTDTWFNAFFESYWQKYTHLSQPVLRVRLSGSGTLRLYRRSSEQDASLIREIDFVGQDREMCIEPSKEPTVSPNAGLLFLELEAHSSEVVMHQAEWMMREVETRPVCLAAGICTFSRASLLIRNITTLLGDPVVADVLERVIVVDQGADKVRDHPGFAVLSRSAAGRLLLVEQINRGGSGGFTRCLLDAQNSGSATHIVLMDDDIIAEPESLLRAAAFLSLARDDLAIGGHMLDRLRPRQLVESGSHYLPEQVRVNEPSRQRLDQANDLMPFLEPQPRHYNGWWFLAFPLAVVQRAGLPLPLFLRGDDVEFGCRLMRQGVPTVALPGVAVWHEPFERKGRGWHAFYELRNYLIVGALHFPLVGATTVARRFFSRLLDELLAYDYYEAWLLCEATAAYLRGPRALHQSPDKLHNRLLEMRQALVATTQPHDGTQQTPLTARSRMGPRALRAWRWLLVLRNVLLPSPSSKTRPQRVVKGNGEQWYDVAGADVVAVAEPHRADLVVLRRSWGRFVSLFLRGLGLALRLIVSQRHTVERWRLGYWSLTRPAFWKDHLQVERIRVEPRPLESSTEDDSLTVAAQ